MEKMQNLKIIKLNRQEVIYLKDVIRNKLGELDEEDVGHKILVGILNKLTLA